MTAEPVSQSVTTVPLIRVLFADDSRSIRTMARYTLSSKQGFFFLEAADGAEALAICDREPVDCVVLDVDMPGLSGFDVLAELHRSRPALPVVMLSGFCEPAVTNRAFAGGVAAYLDKASELPLLAQTVRGVLDRPGGRAQTAPLRTAPDRTAPSPGPLPPDRKSELQRFEYVVSHDLAEPVRVMGGFAGLLLTNYSSALDDRGQSMLNQIVESAQRMQAMIDNLLVYSRAAELRPRDEVVDVAARVREVVRSLETRIAERGAVVTVGDLPTAVGDPAMMSTIFGQLILNGLLFNTATVPRITVSGRVNKHLVSLTVEDNGIGVDPVHYEAVFDLCRRLNTRDEYPGTGVGLALCRRLAALQHGTIHLGPGGSGGSVATLTLPTRASRPGASS